ncbi:biogenesis of lysosome-related organelles complex 1 subunit 3-like [Liolophura sinensis]|uniref:biogenesis of lysosome-related organelles complex 1 subunit 3-like n=1 Tax=Liolophura sinensis TaxID=3198878 RepID=UPI00315912A7
MENSNKFQTVVEGEAPESDEDEEVRQISENSQSQNDTVSTPQRVRTGLVVAGEASESEEEEIDTRETVPPLMVNKDGEGDGSRVLLREESHSPLLDRQAEKPKYNTLLHKKLRERHAMFRRHLVASSAQMYLSASKDLHNTTQQLMKTQLVVQDISHNMRLLTNDLFHLEDRIDIISSCNLLPDINIQM